MVKVKELFAKILQEIKKSVRMSGMVSSGSNLNNYTDTGAYAISSSLDVTPTNMPFNTTWGNLLVYKNSDSSNLITQLFTGAAGRTFVRNKTSETTWTDWVEFTRMFGNLGNGTDLNDVLTNGIYRVPSGDGYSFPNTPDNLTWGTLFVYGSNTGITVTQIFTTKTGFYYRTYSNSAWGDWLRMVNGVKGNAETDYRSGNVNLTPANIGAVPTTRTVNGHALSSNVTVTASDIGVSTGANKITYSSLSESADNISISANSATNVYIDIAVPTGSSRAAMSLRGYYIENASSSGANAANCGVDQVYFSASQNKYCVRVRNYASSLTANVKVTLYMSAAVTA